MPVCRHLAGDILTLCIDGNPCESEIRRRAEIMLRLARGLSGRCALVVQGLLYRGIAHMAGSYMSAWRAVEFDTFEDLQQAEEWLHLGTRGYGVPPELS